jgi:hypothetical protein
MIRYLLIAFALYSPVANSTEVNIGEQVAVRNMTATRDYTILFRELRNNHIEFELSIPEYNVELHVDYYQQHELTTRAFTISVIEEATELFFDWIDIKGYTITNNRRAHRTLAVYDLDFGTLNSLVVDNFTTRAAQGRTGDVNALYEAHKTPDNSNAILMGANRRASDISRATTIAHELAHWWCDYFRIYDRYYIQADGKPDMEAPAYDFQRYYARRTRF